MPSTTDTGNAIRMTKVTQDIVKYLDKINVYFNGTYAFNNYDDAENTLLIMADTLLTMVDAMHNIPCEHGMSEVFGRVPGDVKWKVGQY